LEGIAFPKEYLDLSRRIELYARVLWLKSKHVRGLKLQAARLCGKSEFCPPRDEAEFETRRSRDLVRSARPLLARHPLYSLYLKHIPGIGEKLAIMLIGIVRPHIYANQSKMWADCGLAPPEYYRAKCGNERCFNTKCKAVLMEAAHSVARHSDTYRVYMQRWFEEERPRCLEERGCGEGDERCARAAEAWAFARARRKLAKLLASHLFTAARMVVGLPAPKPYVQFAGIRETVLEPFVVVRGREITLARYMEKQRG